MSLTWKDHVIATRAQHPTLPLKEVLKTASVTYKRKNFRKPYVSIDINGIPCQFVLFSGAYLHTLSLLGR